MILACCPGHCASFASEQKFELLLNFAKLIDIIHGFQVFNRDSTGLDATSLWTMRFRSPLVIKNLLPYKIILVLADTTTGLDAPVFEVGVGASVEVHEFDMTRKIRMSIQLKAWPFPAESLHTSLALILIFGRLKKGHFT